MDLIEIPYNPREFNRLDSAFFKQNTLKVARELLGKYLIHELANGEILGGMIVETEAYTGDDPACHAYANHQRMLQGLPITGKSAELFSAPGTSYVYLNYGMYWLFNIVTEKKGNAGAVLIRALEPCFGLETMKANRPKIRKPWDIANGPGKLTIALGINQSHNGINLEDGPVFIVSSINSENNKFVVVSTPRIGISRAVDRKWRFLIANDSVSGPTPNS